MSKFCKKNYLTIARNIWVGQIYEFAKNVGLDRIDKDTDLPDWNLSRLWRITADHVNNILFLYTDSMYKNNFIQNVECAFVNIIK